MGTICILLGMIVILGSIFLGFTIVNQLKDFLVTLSTNFVGVTGGLTITQMYILMIGVFGFFGLLMGLNLIMHGLTYNGVRKLTRSRH